MAHNRHKRCSANEAALPAPAWCKHIEHQAAAWKPKKVVRVVTMQRAHGPASASD